MSNIRNGITLRNEKTSNSKQNQLKQPPKRLTDKFQQNSAEFKSNYQQNFIKQQYHDNGNRDEDDLSLSTSIDQDLLTQVKQKGYYNNRKNTLVYSNEVAKRASIIRQRFGDVHVVSGKGRKNDISNNKSVSDQEKECNPLQLSKTLKSREFANRIAKLKHKLDQVTDNESWIVTRIENVFLTANK
eukprot:UN04293